MDFLFSPLGIAVIVLVLALVGTGATVAVRSAKAKKQLEPSKAKQLEAGGEQAGEQEESPAASSQVLKPSGQDKEAESGAEQAAKAAPEPLVTTPGTEEETAASEESGKVLEPEVPVSSEELPEAQANLETPEPAQGRMQRLRSRLAKSGSFGKMLLGVLGRGDLSAADWEEIEDTLLMADLGIAATDELMEELRAQAKVLGTSDPAKIREVLRAKLIELVNPDFDRSLGKPLDKTIYLANAGSGTARNPGAP